MASAASSVTSSGNFDVNSIVTQLMAVERKPLIKLDAKEADYQAKLTAFGTVKGALSSFETAVHALNSSTKFNSLSATPSDASVLTAFTSSIAEAGTYSLEVTHLAQAQTLIADGQATLTEAIGSGADTTVTFDFGTITGGTFSDYVPDIDTGGTGGTYSGSTFTSSGNGTYSITLNSGNNTLENIRDSINAANMGVTATIFSDGSANPYRLVLSTDSLGASNSLNITVSGDATLSNLLTNNPGAVAAVAGSSTDPLGTKVAAAAAGTAGGSIAAGALVANTSNGAISIGAVTLPGTTAKANGDAIALAINTALAAAAGGAAVNGMAAADVDGIITITAGSSAITLSVGGFAADSATATANRAALITQTGFNAAQLGTQAVGTQSMAETIAAKNANLLVNGVAVSKTSNTVSDVIHGVTLNLLKATTAPISLTLKHDTASVSTSITSFVKAYNDLTTSLKTVSAYDPKTKVSAALQGDGTIRNLQSQLRGLLGTAAGDATSTFRSLSSIGVTFQRDGTLTLDQDKLDSAMTSNFSGIATLFTSANGYASKLNSWATSLLAPDGSLSSRTDGIGRSISNIGKQRDTLNTRLLVIERTYRAQFTALDTMLSSMNSTSTYLTQQLAQMSSNN